MENRVIFVIVRLVIGLLLVGAGLMWGRHEIREFEKAPEATIFGIVMELLIDHPPAILIILTLLVFGFFLIGSVFFY